MEFATPPNGTALLENKRMKKVDSKVLARCLILKLRECAKSSDQRARDTLVTRLVRVLDKK